MHKDSDLLAVIMAVRTGLVTKDQVSECGTYWKGDGKNTLTDLLVQQGFLKPGARVAVDDLVNAKVDEYGQDLAELLSESPELHQFIVDACSTEVPDLEETIMEWSASTASAIKALAADTSPSSPLDETQKPVPVDSQQAPTDVSLQAILGEKYEFKNELGRSGLCRVVEAVDRDFDRTVAIKMMLPGHSTDALERFHVEGRVTGRLMHPNIVPVYEIGAIKQPEGEAPYFAMAKIDGQDLQSIFHDLTVDAKDAARKYSRARLLRVFHEACDAIAYAHDNGVVHQDLRVGNIMMGDYGQVFVVGWGQAALSEADADRRADINALGGILRDILSSPAPADGSPADLGRIVGKALAGEGGIQYASARELSEDMQGFLEGA